MRFDNYYIEIVIKYWLPLLWLPMHIVKATILHIAFLNWGEIERSQTAAIIVGVCEILTSFTLLFFVVMQVSYT